MDKTNGYSFADGEPNTPKKSNILNLLAVGFWLFIFNVLIWVFGLLITSLLVTWCAITIVAIIDALFNYFAIQYCKKNWYKLQSTSKNDSPKAKPAEPASLADKIAGTFATLLFINLFIWSPMFFIDNKSLALFVSPFLAVTSIIATFFIIKFFKKHWDKITRCRYRSSSDPFRRSSTPSDYFTLPYGRFNRRR